MVYDVVGADDLTNAIALNSMGGNASPAWSAPRSAGC